MRKKEKIKNEDQLKEFLKPKNIKQEKQNEKKRENKK